MNVGVIVATLGTRETLAEALRSAVGAQETLGGPILVIAPDESCRRWFPGEGDVRLTVADVSLYAAWNMGPTR